MQNCKSISAFVAMLYNQLLHCIALQCIVRNDDVRLTKELYVIILSSSMQISGPLFTWFTHFDISVVMYCQD